MNMKWADTLALHLAGSKPDARRFDSTMALQKQIDTDILSIHCVANGGT